MGIKTWWLANFGSEADRTQYIVHFGGPKRDAVWVRGKNAVEAYASKVLARNDRVLWASIGPDYGGDPIRYYRDINDSMHRLEIGEGAAKFWVGSLFTDSLRMEPAAFVIGEDRASTLSRTKSALETNPAFEGAYVNAFNGGGMGWIAGNFTDDLTRDDHGGVVVCDVIEEQRLQKIAALRSELSELEG